MPEFSYPSASGHRDRSTIASVTYIVAREWPGVERRKIVHRLQWFANRTTHVNNATLLPTQWPGQVAGPGSAIRSVRTHKCISDSTLCHPRWCPTGLFPPAGESSYLSVIGRLSVTDAARSLCWQSGKHPPSVTDNRPESSVRLCEHASSGVWVKNVPRASGSRRNRTACFCEAGSKSGPASDKVYGLPGRKIAAVFRVGPIARLALRHG